VQSVVQGPGNAGSAGVYNYLTGNDPAKWHTKVPGFSEVILQDVWSGVDLRIYGNGSNLEQEFIVRPGADLGQVQISYRGIEKIGISQDGSLEVDYGLRQVARDETKNLSGNCR
jgi:hypothetical protein